MLRNTASECKLNKTFESIPPACSIASKTSARIPMNINQEEIRCAHKIVDIVHRSEIGLKADN